MNRAERRRQDRLQKMPGPSPAGGELQRLLSEAVVHHQSGRLSQAEQAYHQILQRHPNHPEALHLLGLIAFRTGRLDRAVDLIAQAIQHDSSKAPYCFNLGVVLQRQGKLVEAMAAYTKALSLNPRYVEAQSNLGNVLLEQGRLEDAVFAYRQALRLNPDYVEAHNNLGVALKEQGKIEDAVAAYQEALNLNPNHVEAHSNLGIALMEHGKLDEAVASLERALRIKPDYVKAIYNLAFARLWQQRFDQALSCLRKSAQIKLDHGRPVSDQLVSRSRLKHEAEQFQYLLDRRLIHESHQAGLQQLKQLKQQGDRQADGTGRMSVGGEELAAISAAFNRIIHYGDSPALTDGALNAALDVPAIEARYTASSPEVMYIDHLLTDEALQSLRRFCLESTIWKRDYENGYLGAFIGDGFACPLLLQIAEELRLRFPGIFKQHLLTQAWTFKYDSELRGLNIHADAAAVNVNFWLTPDEANLDQTTGGLIVWDKEAPKEWNFKDYNSSKNEPAVREFLKHSGARAIAIPYRANRAVVFNSDLFHETDRFSFKDEYE
ncbi:MAG: tetratricopeptide repeat protein, partial [Nitrospiraceae bacterium]